MVDTQYRQIVAREVDGFELDDFVEFQTALGEQIQGKTRKEENWRSSFHVYLFDSRGLGIGRLYLRVHGEELLTLSDFGLDRKRERIGTNLVAALLEKFPKAQIQGENPNTVARAWHHHLENVFGDRMIPFSDDSAGR